MVRLSGRMADMFPPMSERPEYGAVFLGEAEVGAQRYEYCGRIAG